MPCVWRKFCRSSYVQVLEQDLVACCSLALGHGYETTYFIFLFSHFGLFQPLLPLFSTVYLLEIHTSPATFATLNWSPYLIWSNIVKVVYTTPPCQSTNPKTTSRRIGWNALVVIPYSLILFTYAGDYSSWKEAREGKVVVRESFSMLWILYPRCG